MKNILNENELSDLSEISFHKKNKIDISNKVASKNKNELFCTYIIRHFANHMIISLANKSLANKTLTVNLHSSTHNLQDILDSILISIIPNDVYCKTDIMDKSLKDNRQFFLNLKCLKLSKYTFYFSLSQEFLRFIYKYLTNAPANRLKTNSKLSKDQLHIVSTFLENIDLGAGFSKININYNKLPYYLRKENINSLADNKGKNTESLVFMNSLKYQANLMFNLYTNNVTLPILVLRDKTDKNIVEQIDMKELIKNYNLALARTDNKKFIDNLSLCLQISNYKQIKLSKLKQLKAGNKLALSSEECYDFCVDSKKIFSADIKNVKLNLTKTKGEINYAITGIN